MNDPYDSAAARKSLLGPTLVFKGELSADEELFVQGRVEGTITHTQRLIVAPEGNVKANVRAQVVVVEGTVEGDIQAEKSVVVKDGAKMRGNLTSPSVSIQEGAHFNGSVAMQAPPAAGSQAAPASAVEKAADRHYAHGT